jgi:protein-L-isoaspartate(D-aspartate) O-methyltransferase
MFLSYKIKLTFVTVINNAVVTSDTYKHKGLRKNLVNLLRSKGITDEAVLGAIESVPRHLFMDNAFLKFAYDDSAFPIGAGQTISQPYTVAYQTSLLNLREGEKVLEIGTGSGYQTSILIEMGAKVFTIERQKLLYEKASKFLPSIGYNAKFFFGDGYKGLPAYAPFDKILVTAGAPFIPEDLIMQLKAGGAMVIPVGAGTTQIMNRIVKTGENEIKRTELDTFSFVPLLSDKVV